MRPSNFRSRRGARGYILAFVLVMLLVLTIIATSVLGSSLSGSIAMDASRFQHQAAINASAGAQDALARLRAGQISQWQTLPHCTSAEACPVAPPPYVLAAPVMPGETSSRYVVTVFQSMFPRPGLDGMGLDVTGGSQMPLVIISSMGTAQDNPQYSAVIEIEVQMPSGGTGGNTIAGGG